MPPRPKSARLWIRPARPGRAACYFIVDRNRQISCGTANLAEAEKQLTAHLAAKHDPRAANVSRSTDQIPVSDVLGVYIREKAPKHARPWATGRRMVRLIEFFEGKTLADINGALCRDFAKQASTDAVARRDLEDLRAAINHHLREGLHDRIVSVVLPERRPSRERWLTRDEVAALLWRCWRRGKSKHLARFVLLSVYTGRRMSVVLGASFKREQGRTFLDTRAGMLRPPERVQQTKKRNPPIPLPSRLLAHLRRWERMGVRYPASYGGETTDRCRALTTAAREAGLGDDVTPHVLRHTAASWLVQNGTDMFKASRYLGMSVPTLEKIYAHHGVEHLRDAAESLGRH